MRWRYASRSGISPLDVVTMANPSPRSTRGNSEALRYTRVPDLETRTSCVIAGRFCWYFKYTRRVRCDGCSPTGLYVRMKPSCFNTARICSTIREARRSTVGCFAREAFRSRVNPSAIVSVAAIALPARFHQARDFPAPGHFTEADPAQAKPPIEAAAASAAVAPVNGAHLELRGALGALDPGGPRHHDPSAFGEGVEGFANGNPKPFRRANASSRVAAVVTNVMSIPRGYGVLSKMTSGKIVCSCSPKL